MPSSRRAFLSRVTPVLQALLAVFVARAVCAASYPPGLHFRTIDTPRLSVHFPEGLEPAARQAAALSTEILGDLEARYAVSLPRLHLVLADVDDSPNAFSSQFPYPLVRVRLAAPDGSDDFGNHDGWLRMVLSHELAHSVHIEAAHGVWGGLRHLLGRAPFTFPNALTPTWMIEGLATYEETRLTAFGRGRDPDSLMVRRMAALEGGFLREDQAAYGLDAWPGGGGSYLFGEGFLRHLTQEYGDDIIPRLARVRSGQLVPYLDELTSRRVTGAPFYFQWNTWTLGERRAAEAEAAPRRAQGLTLSTAITARGIRQYGPCYSPTGEWIAYTSSTLGDDTAIRLVRPDGTEDRRLVERHGGDRVAWTPDGRQIVYDEIETYRKFSRFSDLQVVDVATGRRRRLTRGLRARDPDVAPGGDRVVFVGRADGHSDLFEIGTDGKRLRRITSSATGTEWGAPRFSPEGDALVASRLTEGGRLDVVLIDPATGAQAALTEDRAKDVEPTFSADGSHVVFRSDRDGGSNLYAIRLSDLAFSRLTNVLGGAFAPAVSPDGRQLAFSDYSSRGFDLRVTPLDLAGAVPVGRFVDDHPASREMPPPVEAPPHSYSPLSTLLPRYWTPLLWNEGDEWRYGAGTSGSDPLFQHLYGLQVFAGSETQRVSTRGFYQYDRLFPTLLLAFEDLSEPYEDTIIHTRRIDLRLTAPLRRTMRSEQAVSIAWRREHQALGQEGEQRERDLGGLELAWSLASTRRFPYSISPTEGSRLRVAYLRESPSLGSDHSLSKLTADARGYVRVFGERDVLAVRTGGGFTLGEPEFEESFAVGGFPDSSLFDLGSTNVALLRGYADDAFRGRAFVQANVEYRFPLFSPQRGWITVPAFVRHLHGQVFFDAANAWNGSFGVAEVKTSVGVGLGLDGYLGHRVPLTGVVSLARGLSQGGETRAYLRLGLAF